MGSMGKSKAPKMPGVKKVMPGGKGPKTGSKEAFRKQNTSKVGMGGPSPKSAEKRMKGILI